MSVKKMDQYRNYRANKRTFTRLEVSCYRFDVRVNHILERR